MLKVFDEACRLHGRPGSPLFKRMSNLDLRQRTIAEANLRYQASCMKPENEVSRRNPISSLCPTIRAFALIAVVLVVGLGAWVHADGIVVDETAAHTALLVDEEHNGSHQAVGVHPPLATHCGSGAVCVGAIPMAPMLLPAPETGFARFAIVDFAVASSPIFGLLRPPRLG